MMSLIGGLQPLFTALIFALVLRSYRVAFMGRAGGRFYRRCAALPRLTGIDVGNMALLPILMGLAASLR